MPLKFSFGLVLIAFNVAMTSAALVCLLLLVFRKLGKRTRVQKSVYPSSAFTVEKVRNMKQSPEECFQSSARKNAEESRRACFLRLPSLLKRWENVSRVESRNVFIHRLLSTLKRLAKQAESRKVFSIVCAFISSTFTAEEVDKAYVPRLPVSRVQKCVYSITLLCLHPWKSKNTETQSRWNCFSRHEHYHSLKK